MKNKLGKRFRLRAGLLSMAISSLLHSVPASADDVAAAEQNLLSGLESIQGLALDKALSHFEELSDQYPKYKLAQLMKADLLALKAGDTQLMDEIRKRYANEVAKLEDEARVRWDFAQSAMREAPGLDKYVLKSAGQSHLLIVSLNESRLYLYERNAKTGHMQRVADYYVTIGRKGSGKQKEGDLRTPLGVYHVVDLLPGAMLPDLYGVGALPLNYPNKWDRSQGKTGSGIWLHGVPSDTYTRAPRASRGCVVLNNNAMQKLLSDYKLSYATPVVIVDEDKQAFSFSDDKKVVLKEVKAWLSDHYAKVPWKSVSVYRYPNEKNLFYVTFPSHNKTELVHQFWQRDPEGDWRMVLQSEEPVQVKTRV
ncbi:L,D-transpeptidase family protein [Thiomicrorhabdus heinhorstiae]|uniref:L,D-transpeptidase n=1 Tax=Thiomicrorhabdus heinhorstiae TaxID=2748010 RepID=A0ABS0BZ58_9GAMM|nr:L,D-transpeptidase [Thiomicrorhabdus heinhorstiae]MBF6057256.1 L,D-transpeptidase [Thiomicrorhabdus heinhorstiae]